MKGRALRRALQTKDATSRLSGIPLITDSTEWITQEKALAYLANNKRNRIINWRAVEQYADAMKCGKWEFHGQGIMFDQDGNLLTGQKRLWALIYSGLDGLHMRVSRGNPRSVAHLIDRGTPQTSRDLASRATGRKHSPAESSVARAICALNGNLKPSVDELATAIEVNAVATSAVLRATSGTRKTRAVLMVIAALVNQTSDADAEVACQVAASIDGASKRLELRLHPQTAQECWGRGAAFALAMKCAADVVAENKK